MHSVVADKEFKCNIAFVYQWHQISLNNKNGNKVSFFSIGFLCSLNMKLFWTRRQGLLGLLRNHPLVSASFFLLVVFFFTLSGKQNKEGNVMVASGLVGKVLSQNLIQREAFQTTIQQAKNKFLFQFQREIDPWNFENSFISVSSITSYTVKVHCIKVKIKKTIGGQTAAQAPPWSG